MTCYDHFTALGMVLQQILFLPVLNYQSADNFRRRASLFGLTLAPMQRETAMARSQFSRRHMHWCCASVPKCGYGITSKYDL